MRTRPGGPALTGLPLMHETGHVDLFLRALDDGAVLDIVAIRLGRAGRRVERLPMLGAQHWRPATKPRK